LFKILPPSRLDIHINFKSSLTIKQGLLYIL